MNDAVSAIESPDIFIPAKILFFFKIARLT
jgi:hypothetical protein